MSVVQAQWNLDQSSRSVVGIARGILQAATTDNVQVLAILACERFGATLAISPETCSKVEREVLPTPEHAVVNFLKLTVGYNANDCVTQFGNSMAGVQYLALAAAFVGTMDHFKAASAIQEMVVNTAFDKTMVPTIRQVQDLLASIEPRCLRTGFANSVSGWQTLLTATTHEYFQTSNLGRISMFPARQGLLNLVDAFRQLRRMGNEDVLGITINVTSSGAAWTIAFIKWCLGLPPSIFFDDGTKFLVQDGSDVTVVISNTTGISGSLEVDVHSSIKNPSRLVRSSLDGHVAGMIDIPSFGQELLQHHELDDELMKRALQQALPYGLGQVLKLLIIIEEDMLDRSHKPFKAQEMKEPLSKSQQLIIKSRVSPFPEDPGIRRMLSLLFSFPEQSILSLEDGLSIADLPVISLYLKQVKQACLCSDCKPEGASCGCRQDVFWDSLSAIIAAVLSLSLFQSPESLRVWSGNLNTTYNHYSHAFINAIYLVLKKGVYARCSARILVLWALRYVGHVDIEFTRVPLLSCYKGQAVWPIVYENHTVSRRGYLSMAWLSGMIYHKNEPYELVHSPEGWGRTKDGIENPKCDEAVTSPRNLCPNDLHLQWSVTPRGKGLLEAELGVTSIPLSMFSVQAGGFYNKLSKVVLVEPCGHSPDAALPSADKFATFTKPIPEILKAKGDHVNVVAVDGNDELRFLALTSLCGDEKGIPSAVLRKGACLSCCLDFCRTTGINVLIL